MLDLDLDVLTAVKKNRNAEKMAGNPEVAYTMRYHEQDPNNPRNHVYVMGNPSLSKVRVMLIGVRNNTAGTTKDFVVWVDELRVTDFDSEGGWAAKANMTLNLSDIGVLNVGWHKETSGFGSVDQSMTQRRLDNYDQYNVAVQADLGRFIPEKVKLRAPVYFSYSNEKTTPKYNPLDEDVLLKDALDACSTEEQKDSIKSYAVTEQVVKNFSISGLKFDVKSKNPMPWDPANFTFNYSFNKSHKTDPNYVYENTNDYRGSMQYSWTPYIKPFRPLEKAIDAKNKNMKFFREWEFRWLPTSLAFSTNISRYYYEQQTRNETDVDIVLPVSVSKNFLWDRQFALTWNFTKSLNMSFNSQTTAHIMEPMGQVNRKLFPDEYREWRDSVWRSIKDLGTPWAYNQTFTASYKAPFNAIPILSFITANATYNATYNWIRGTVIGDVFSGNNIANQSSFNVDCRLNMETLYSKVPYLKDVHKRFSGGSGGRNNDRDKKQTKKAKKFDRTFQLSNDTTTMVKHNMNVKKVRVTATTVDGKRYPVKFNIKDNNNIEILNRDSKSIKVTVTEILGSDKKNFGTELAQYLTRLAMSVRSVNVRWRHVQSMSVPQFKPSVGDAFGQDTHYDALAPGLDFAFDSTQTSPAIFSRTQELNMEVVVEPITGLKITLTGNRTDNRTNQVQFMYDDMGVIYSGSYTKTHMAIATALRGVSANNEYMSSAFSQFLNNIPIVAQRLQDRYVGQNYPDRGFLRGTGYANTPFNPEHGAVNASGSDVMIPAFLAAYSGRDASKVNLNPFPGIKSILPNWRVTYDGLSKIAAVKKVLKSLTLTHAYQCTYSVGNFTSYTDWVSIGENMGFTSDALTGGPIPNSPYNISSVTITEKFAPLIGVNATFKNDLSFNVEYRDARTLALNIAALQLVETLQKSFVVGASYKIANFNTILKMKKKQEGVNNDLTLNFNLQFNNNTALIRKIDVNTTQATSGTRTLGINFSANYVMSKRITLGAFFDHQVNTPLVSTTAYPTTNTNYGISLNISLTK